MQYDCHYLIMRFFCQTEEFKSCPPGFLYILALSMVIKEVQADDVVLSTRQYQEGECIFSLVFYERFTFKKNWINADDIDYILPR